MRRGGILHRDISVGNILIIDDPEEQEQFCGFIHDFDYSSMTRDLPQGDISSLSVTALAELLAADDVDEQLQERTVRKRMLSRCIRHADSHDRELSYSCQMISSLRALTPPWRTISATISTRSTGSCSGLCCATQHTTHFMSGVGAHRTAVPTCSSRATVMQLQVQSGTGFGTGRTSSSLATPRRPDRADAGIRRADARERGLAAGASS